jgi:hypothetical protein
VGVGANSTESILLCAATPAAPGQPQYVSSTETQITFEWVAPSENGGSLVETYQIFSKLATQSEQEWLQVGETDLNT